MPARLLHHPARVTTPTRPTTDFAEALGHARGPGPELDGDGFVSGRFRFVSGRFRTSGECGRTPKERTATLQRCDDCAWVSFDYLSVREPRKRDANSMR